MYPVCAFLSVQTLPRPGSYGLRQGSKSHVDPTMVANIGVASESVTERCCCCCLRPEFGFFFLYFLFDRVWVVQYRRHRWIRRVKLFSVLLLLFPCRLFLVVVRDFYTVFFFCFSTILCKCGYVRVFIYKQRSFFSSLLFVNNISPLLLLFFLLVPPVVVPLFLFFLRVRRRVLFALAWCTYLCHPIPKPAAASAAANQWCQVDARCWLRFYGH